jgi:predicted DNA-binding transcriptional regulator AlpA
MTGAVDRARREQTTRAAAAASRDAIAALSASVAAGARRDLDEAEARQAVAAVAGALPEALARALAEVDELPLVEVARVLRMSVRGLAEAMRAGRIALQAKRAGRSVVVLRRDLESLTGAPPAPADPLVRLLAAAIVRSMPEAREAAPAALLTTEELAARTGRSRKEIWRDVAAGTYPVRPVRFGKVLRFPATAVGAVGKKG